MLKAIPESHPTASTLESTHVEERTVTSSDAGHWSLLSGGIFQVPDMGGITELTVTGLDSSQGRERDVLDGLVGLARTSALHDTQLPAEVTQSVVSMIADNPVEEGFLHPAGSEVRDIVRRYGEERFYMMVRDHLEEPTLAVSLLRLIGDEPIANRQAFFSLLAAGLSSSKTAVREATMGVIEVWDHPIGMQLLREHRDPVPWLREYVRAILQG